MFFHSLFDRIISPDDYTPGIRLIRLLLRLPAWLFSLIVRGRGWLYDAGWLKTVRLPVPVISVGGLTVGGAGKTPVVRYLAELLKNMGYRPVIVSRGYGRSDHRVGHVSLEDSWHRAGDEPTLLAALLPGTPVVVGADRVAAGRYALAEFQADVLILDDGFQHRRLYRDLDMVVYDSTGYQPNLYVLPAGPLREPMRALQRARCLILTRTDQAGTLADLCRHANSANPEIGIIESTYRPVHLRKLSDHTILPMDQLKNQPVLMLCGIANPASFSRTVSDLGISVVSTLHFPDHHPFTMADMDRAVQAARQAEVPWIITTEKDAVRIPDHPIRSCLLALDIALSIPAGEERLRNLILSLDIPK